MPTKLEQIETSAKKYSKKRSVVITHVTELNDAITQLKRKHLPAIKAAVNEAVQAESELNALVEQSPTLFVKPRTIVCYGIKVGMQKQKGKTTINDVDKTIKLIREKLPNQASQLIDIKESVNKKALGEVSVADLKKIGCTVTADTDAVLIKPTDSEVDKLVTALLGEETK